ncbi:MAG: tetratricopeptide repeat protein [Gammaproteobacteria bacterium]|nr:tetratricopeptide repeat protein [Gammaproteobacteria bacterium]
MHESDQEQIQLIKDWWKQYGSAILTGVIVFLVANFGWRYWHQTTALRIARASVTYTQVLNAFDQKKTEDAESLAKNLMQDYKRSPYASLAAFLLAKNAVQDKNYSAAIEDLQWIINHAKSKSFRQVARIRLARVLIATKKPQLANEALSALDDPAYLAMVDETKGDIFALLGDNENAMQSYRKALNESKPELTAPLLEMKVAE